MAIANAPARRRGPVLVSVAQDAWDEARVENDSLRNELRQVAVLVVPAVRVHAYVAAIGESLEAEQLAAFVAAKLQQIARRHQ